MYFYLSLYILRTQCLSVIFSLSLFFTCPFTSSKHSLLACLFICATSSFYPNEQIQISKVCILCFGFWCVVFISNIYSIFFPSLLFLYWIFFWSVIFFFSPSSVSRPWDFISDVSANQNDSIEYRIHFIYWKLCDLCYAMLCYSMI